MKVLLLFILLTGSAAADVSVKLFQASRMTDDNAFQVGDWSGVQLSLQDDSDSYFFVSDETMKVVLYGAGSYETMMTGIGLGIKKTLAPNIKLFGQVGYYMVDNNLGRKRGMNEGLLYLLNNNYALWNNNNYVGFDEYEVRQKDTIGGEIGIEIDYPITKKLLFGVSASYRMMKIQETHIGYYDEWANDPNHWWQMSLARNYSSTNFGLSLSYEF